MAPRRNLTLFALAWLFTLHVAATWTYDSSYIGQDKRFTWDVSYARISTQVDTDEIHFNNKPVIVVGGKFGPPPVRVVQGDTIYLTVRNLKTGTGPWIDAGITVHAHGFWQRNNNQEDGPAGITQCPIYPGEEFTYKWIAEQCGTFWIHSHVVGQYPYGLRTPLVVDCVETDEPTKYHYDPNKDFTMALNDHWNNGQELVDKNYFARKCCLKNDKTNCGLDPPPHAADINDSLQGKVIFKDDTPNASADPNFRVRIVNQAAFASFIVFSPNPLVNLEVFEVDGVALERAIAVKSIEVHPGQRYSARVGQIPLQATDVVLMAAIDPGRYSGSDCVIETMRWTDTSLTKKFDFAKYALAKFKLTSTTSEPPTPVFADPPKVRCWDLLCWYSDDSGSGPGTFWNMPSHASNIGGRFNDILQYRNAVPRQVEAAPTWNAATSDIFFIGLTEDDRFATMNHKEFHTPSEPVMLKDIRERADPSQTPCALPWDNPAPGDGPWPYYGTNNTYATDQGRTIYLAVWSQLGAHPFHVHGTDFQVLYQTARGTKEDFDTGAITTRIKNGGWISNPMRRDTVYLESKTWTILAFKADNPGAWMAHCHNDFHTSSGMAGLILVHPDRRRTDWDRSAAGNRIFEQCRFVAVDDTGKHGFDKYTIKCCQNNGQSCPDMILSRDNAYWSQQRGTA